MNDINDFILKLHNDKKLCIESCTMMEEEGWCPRSNYAGTIKEDVLIKLIKSSYHRVHLKGFLSDFALYFTTEEVTPRVFRLLMNYRGKGWRKSILIGLSHCKLSRYQLLQLNKLHIHEAFMALTEDCSRYPCFTVYDFQEILKPWKNKVPEYLQDCIEKYYNKTLQNEKAMDQKQLQRLQSDKGLGEHE